MVYTQPPHLTNEEIESLLKEAQIARFCSLNENGTIHATPVWYKYEDGQVTIFTPDASRKAKNVKGNKNVTILIDVEGPPTRGVLIYGKAELDYDNLMPFAVSYFEKYMPRDKAELLAQGLFKISKGVKIRVRPEHIASFDYSKDDEYRDAHQG